MKVIYEGVDIYPEISVNRCYHDMYACGQSDELLLRLNDTRNLWDVWGPQKGDRISIEDGNAKTGQMYVAGIIPESGMITIQAYSMPLAAKEKRSRSWEKVRFLQLAKGIADQYGLAFETYGIIDHLYEYVIQNSLADFAFFQGRCILEGAAFLVYDGKLILYDEAYMEQQSPIDTLTILPLDSFEYHTEEAFGSAEIVNGKFTGSFSLGNGETLKKILPINISDQSEANRFAKGILRTANKEAVSGILWTDTLLRDYAAGSVVNLKTEGNASWDGPAFIDRIRFDYVKGTSKVFFRKPLEGY